MARTRRLLLVPLALAAAGGGVLLTTHEPAEGDAGLPPIETIAKRVETLRGLEFRSMPTVRRITAKQLQRESSRQVRDLSSRKRGEVADQVDLTALLGFTSKDADVDDTGSTASVVGVYDDRTRTLTIVKDAPGGRAERELTIAHELDHALEDQHFDLGRLMRGSVSDDVASARRAVVEGSAHLLELRYARKHLGGERSVRKLAAAVPASTVKGSAAYAMNDVRFAYVDGARYLARRFAAGGNAAVDRELRVPPRSTAAVLHPDARDTGQGPVRLRVRRAAGTGFERVSAGTFGEFDTSQLLVLGATADAEATRVRAAKAAAGWRAGRYELWRAGGKRREGCSEPCVERDLVVLGWRFESPRAAAAFAGALEPYVETFQALRPAGKGLWRGDATAAAVRTRGADVRLVFAPLPALATRVAERG